MSYSDIARELSLDGFSVTKQAVHGWAKGTRRPDIQAKAHRQALCKVLKTDEASLLQLLGYETQNFDLSPKAMYVAQIIDRLPEDAQTLIVNIVEGVAKPYIEPAHE